MIASRHIAILVAVSVTLCPLQCLFACHGHMAHSLGCGDSKAMLSDEHDHEHQHDGPADHQEPCQHHQHGHCVCQGALPVQLFVLDDTGAVDWYSLPPNQACGADTYVASGLLSPRVSASFFWPHLRSGQGLCALISCWRN